MQQNYYELRITPKKYYSLFVDIIISLSDEAIEECEGTIILRSLEPLESVRFGVEAFRDALSQNVHESIEVSIEEAIKPNEDWIKAYKEAIAPLHVGAFYIHPSWVDDDKDKHNIIIDPALAFGSGHHETTHGCLLMLQKYLKEGQSLLDVGCGSGILGLCASKLGARVHLCDTDEQAIQSTQENFKLNHAHYEKLWQGSVQKREENYDVVVANIIADVLIMIASDLQSALKPQGILIVSGILGNYINKVEAKYASMSVVEKYQQEEWVTLVLRAQ